MQFCGISEDGKTVRRIIAENNGGYMGKRKFNTVTVGFTILILLVVMLLVANSLRRSSHIVLPDITKDPVSGSESIGLSDNSGVTIAVTPETVQDVIETLSRPQNYVRNLTVETLWSGGSGSVQITAAVSGLWTRTDVYQTDGRVRHTMTDGADTYIWYDSSRVYYQGNAGDIDADDEQHIPTYEDILTLDIPQIAMADYRTFSEQSCIYVETVQDDSGYLQRYWVSVDSGLLIGAERLYNGDTVYRMAAQPVLEELPDSEDFTLPDGRCIHIVAT